MNVWDGMEDVHAKAMSLAELPRLALLFVGEKGVGKRELAREVHEHSHQDLPFVEADARNLAAPLQTYIEASERGSLFIRDANHLEPRELSQVQSLLQDHTYLSATGHTRQSWEGRLIISTRTVDPMWQGHLEPIEVPRLRDRGPDAVRTLSGLLYANLQEHHLPAQGAKVSLAERVGDARFWDALLGYPWVENVAELIRVLTHVLTQGHLSASKPYDLDTLPEPVRRHLLGQDSSPQAEPIDAQAIRERLRTIREEDMCPRQGPNWTQRLEDASFDLECALARFISHYEDASEWASSRQRERQRKKLFQGLRIPRECALQASIVRAFVATLSLKNEQTEQNTAKAPTASDLSLDYGGSFKQATNRQLGVRGQIVLGLKQWYKDEW